MTFTIGRLGPLAEGPYAIQHNGDQLGFKFDLHPATFAEAQAQRAQILGYANNDDEPVIPITWTGDDHLDGFYRVRAVTAQPIEAYTETNLVTCSVAAQRVTGGWSNPLVETNAIAKSITDGWSLSTDLGIGDAYTVPALVTTQDEYYFDAALFTRENTAYATADGDIWAIYNGDAAGYDLEAIGTLADPSEWYRGRPLLEVDTTGSGGWATVVGRQLPDAANYAGRWRLSNGLIRVSAVSGTAGRLTLEAFDGTSTWDTVATVSRWVGGNDVGFATSNLSAGAEWVSPQVLRNSVDAIVLRFSGVQGTSLTFALRPGIPGVTIYSDSAPRQVRHTSEPQAASSYTRATIGASSGTEVQAIYRSTNDANGNRWVWASPSSTVTADTTNGRLDTGTSAGQPLFLGATNDPTDGIVGTLALARSAMFGLYSQTLVVAR